MKFFRQILILFFATVIFVGTVGVNVFAHYCKIDGVDYSFISPKEDHCQKETIEASCCKLDVQVSKEEPQVNDDCCSDQVTSFKISSEIFQKEIGQNQIIALSSTINPIYQISSSFEVNTDLHYFNHRQPIPKWGRDLLIQNQLFRI
jgi:hypothetical protein